MNLHRHGDLGIMSHQPVINNAKSLSPYRNPTLVMPINSKKEL